jgi:hypothetical protein
MRLKRALRLKSAAIAAGALLVLTGCQQPVPETAVFTGGHYLTEPAATYCDTVDDAAANRCRVDSAAPRRVLVRDGNQVAFNVPSELHHTPWVVVLSVPGKGGKAQRSPYQVDKTYLSITPDFTDSPEILAELVQYSSDGRAVRPTGLWRFLLVKEPRGGS